MSGPEKTYLSQVISAQRFRWGKEHRLRIDLAEGLAVGALRSSVPQILRPVEFAPVTIELVDEAWHDEL